MSRKSGRRKQVINYSVFHSDSEEDDFEMDFVKSKAKSKPKQNKLQKRIESDDEDFNPIDVVSCELESKPKPTKRQKMIESDDEDFNPIDVVSCEPKSKPNSVRTKKANRVVSSDEDFNPKSKEVSMSSESDFSDTENFPQTKKKNEKSKVTVKATVHALNDDSLSKSESVNLKKEPTKHTVAKAKPLSISSLKPTTNNSPKSVPDIQKISSEKSKSLPATPLSGVGSISRTLALPRNPSQSVTSNNITTISGSSTSVLPKRRQWTPPTTVGAASKLKVEVKNDRSPGNLRLGLSRNRKLKPLHRIVNT